MAKRIVASCDNSEAHPDELVDASEVVVSIDSQPRGLDLCPDCLKALVTPLADLLADRGQPVRPDYKPPKAGPQKHPSAAPTRPVDGLTGSPVRKGPGRPPAPARGVPGTNHRESLNACPVPGCTWTGRRTSLYSHAKSIHGETVGVLEGIHGRLLPDGSRQVLPIPCGVKGCPGRFDDPVALAQHMRGHKRAT